MLGYTRDPRLSKIQSSLLDTAINLEAPLKESSYLTLFLTIEPQLLVPEVFRESVFFFLLYIYLFISLIFFFLV
jgi:hypothetical protein